MMVGEAWDANDGSRDIDALTVDFAKAGRRVVRLMGSDPVVSGRGSTVMQACRAAGIAVDVVPCVAAIGDRSSEYCETATKVAISTAYR
jgi:siroheme synthase